MPVEIDEQHVDDMIKMLYEARSRTAEPYTDEKWARLKTLFPGTIRTLRTEALAMINGDDENLA